MSGGVEAIVALPETQEAQEAEHPEPAPAKPSASSKSPEPRAEAKPLRSQIAGREHERRPHQGRVDVQGLKAPWPHGRHARDSGTKARTGTVNR